ncbi:MAG: hypothetical protein ACM31C_06270 [Acidobacteriota bacterium]
MTRAWLLVALAACGDSQVIFEPVIDVPTNDTASAFPLDQLTMSVAHQGDTTDLVSASFTKGQTVSLSRVPFGDDLVVHLTGFVGTSEVAYGRSCPVSVSAGSPPPEPHLYFSRLVKFGQVATDLPALRTLGAAVTYHDGSGLLIGGYDQNTGMPAGTVERFAPQTGELSVLVGELDPDKMVPRFGTVAAPVGTGSDSQIAVIGGQNLDGTGAQVVELVEADQPQGRHVQTVPDANMSRIDLTATALTDGRVIAIGGRPPPSGAPVGDVDEITVESGTAVVNVLRATLTTPRYGHTATRLGDDVGAAVLIAGGLDAAGTPVAAAELFKPLSELFSPTFSATMVVPRSRHQAVRMPDGSVLIIGGVDVSGAPIHQLELFTQDAGFVNLGTKLPPNAGVIDFTATTLPDGRVLLTGGRQTVDGTPLATAFIARLDPIDGSLDIVATDTLQFPRAGHQATLLCDGTVLISGGTADQVPAERYNPPPDGRR